MGVTLDQDLSALNIILQEKNLMEVDATMLVRILATVISQDESSAEAYHINSAQRSLLQNFSLRGQ